MKKFSIFFIVLGICLALTSSIYANSEIKITGNASFDENVSLKPYGYIMDKGNYSITAPVDKSLISLRLNRKDSQLTVDGLLAPSDETLFKVGNLILGDCYGRLNVVGGSKDTVYGVEILNDLTQEGNGIINVKGGSGVSSHGIVVNNLIQFSKGNCINILSAVGGSGNSSYGIKIQDTLLQLGADVINAWGGDDQGSWGIDAKTIIQGGNGSIYSYGGKVSNSHGINAVEIITHGSGLISSTGGEGDNSHGINIVFQDVSFNGLSLFGPTLLLAQGGEGENSHGINIEVEATIDKDDFHILNSGEATIIAKGGSGDNSHGIKVVKSSILPTAMYGIFNQNSSGNSVFTGGSGKNSYGMYTDIYTQGGGVVTAMGGSGNDAYGIYIDLGGTVGGAKFQFGREGAAYSVYIDPSKIDPFSKGAFNIFSTTLQEGGDAVMVPIIDLSKEASMASGIIYSENGVSISKNTDGYIYDYYESPLVPLLKNTAKLEVGSSLDDMVFLQAAEGKISGQFADPEATITMNYIMEKSADEKTYSISVARIKTPQQALSESLAVAEDDIALAELIYNYLTGPDVKEGSKVNLILDMIDNSFTVEEAVSVLSEVKNIGSSDSTLWKDVSLKNMSESQNRLSILMNDKSTLKKSGIFANFVSGSGKYQNSNPTYTGVIIEGLFDLNSFVLGFDSQITFGENTANNSSANIINATLAAGYTFYINEKVKPQVSLNIGYLHNSIKLHRIDFLNEVYEADTKINILKAGISVGNIFEFSENIDFMMSLGINYLYLLSGGYAENNPLGMALVLEKSNAHSLKPELLLSAEYDLGENAFLRGHLSLGYELLDPTFDGSLSWQGYEFNRAQSSQSKDPMSVSAGAELRFEIGNKIAINTGYTFYSQGVYKDHQLKAGLGLKF